MAPFPQKKQDQEKKELHQQEDIDFFETFSLVFKLTIVRVILTIAFSKKLAHETRLETSCIVQIKYRVIICMSSSCHNRNSLT